MTVKAPRTDNLCERWLPAEWELLDASAIQALGRGDADARLQQHALKVIVEKLAGAYEETFVPRESDTSAFLQGRRSVGLQIVKLLKVDLSALRQAAQAAKNQSARKAKP
jgi:hypothetical protein